MKKFLTIFSALALVGCTPTTQVAEGIATHGETVVLSGAKALTIAADAYAEVANRIADRVEAGSFTDDQLRMIKTLNTQAISLIEGGGTALTVAERAASLSLVVTQLSSIVGR